MERLVLHLNSGEKIKVLLEEYENASYPGYGGPEHVIKTAAKEGFIAVNASGFWTPTIGGYNWPTVYPMGTIKKIEVERCTE